MVFAKLHAALQGEDPAQDLQGFRLAGRAVYDLLDDIQQRKLETAAAGVTPWTASPADQLAALCAWCAFALQTVADAHLAAHDEHGAAGYASEQLHDHVLTYYRGVQGWISRGRAVEMSPHTAASPDIALPADFPPPAGAWRNPFSAASITAMQQGLATLGPRAESAVGELARAVDAAVHTAEIDHLRALTGAAGAAATYAPQAPAERLSGAALTAAGTQLLAALNAYLRLGQFAAMPSLLTTEGA